MATHRIFDSLLLALGSLTLVVFVVAVLDSEQVIHLPDPIRQAMGTYGMATVVIALAGGIALIIQHVRDLRRRQKWLKLSAALDSTDETPAHQ